MARTAVPYSSWANNAAVPAPAGTTLDVANGHSIAQSGAERSILLFTNTDAAAHTVTIKAGDPMGMSAGQGDLTFSIPAGSSAYVGPLESARVQQKDGSLYIDLQAGHAGKITAFFIPRGLA
jgi:hypothetical protein